MCEIIRPERGEVYFAPVAPDTVVPIVWGEHHGIVVDTPSQSVAVVYSTPELAAAALRDPAVWSPANAARVEIRALRYRGRDGFARFDWVES